MIRKRGLLYFYTHPDLEEQALRQTKWKEPFYYGKRLKATIEYDGALFLVKTYSRKKVVSDTKKFLKYRNALDYARDYLLNCKY